MFSSQLRTVIFTPDQLLDLIQLVQRLYGSQMVEVGGAISSRICSNTGSSSWKKLGCTFSSLSDFRSALPRLSSSCFGISPLEPLGIPASLATWMPAVLAAARYELSETIPADRFPSRLPWKFRMRGNVAAISFNL